MSCLKIWGVYDFFCELKQDGDPVKSTQAQFFEEGCFIFFYMETKGPSKLKKKFDT